MAARRTEMLFAAAGSAGSAGSARGCCCILVLTAARFARVLRSTVSKLEPGVVAYFVGALVPVAVAFAVAAAVLGEIAAANGQARQENM